jgi:hypothetical protein
MKDFNSSKIILKPVEVKYNKGDKEYCVDVIPKQIWIADEFKSKNNETSDKRYCKL